MKSVALLLVLLITISYFEVSMNNFSEQLWISSFKLLYYTQAETNGHEVISPFGIWTLMTGIACGTTGNSHKQLERVFNLPKNQNTLVKRYIDLTNAVLAQGDNVNLTSRNFVFLDNDFSVYQGFRRALQNDFGASLKVLDFNDPNSACIANTYIGNSGSESSERVSNILRSDDFHESRMILTNVISFKGLWASPFNKFDTVFEPFYDEDKNKAGTVNMMSQIGQFAYLDMDAMKSFIVELPYGNSKYSMIVILPYPSVRIAEMYKNTHEVSLKDILKKLQANGMVDVIVKLPRFHTSTNLELNKPLYGMGVHDIFQPDLASFQRVSKDNMFVSAIVHKADIEITESGTVASTVTTATFSDRSFIPVFHANRPFLYFIMEKTTTTVVFTGIYSKPTIY